VHAVLYDVHGNLPALEAVLADAATAGARTFVLGGDYALFGAFPAETVARLRELDASWIRGNTDRWLADPHDGPGTPEFERSIAYCREQVGEAVAAELAGLAETTTLAGCLFCHASPRSDMETFMPAPQPGEEELLAGAGNDVVVFGHSHLQFIRELDGRTLVNPGSVGMPFDGDRRASYALWHGDARFDLRRVEYDVESYVVAMRERMAVTLGAWVETLVARIERAAFVT
jgi:putative phosphoesterase